MDVAAVKNDTIRWHEISGPELDNVTGNDLFDWNRHDCSVAVNIGVNGDGMSKRFGCHRRAMLLNDVKNDRQGDDGKDDGKACKIASHA
jgi:uncharacterized heparinase superfamily protein